MNLVRFILRASWPTVSTDRLLKLHEAEALYACTEGPAA